MGRGGHAPRWCQSKEGHCCECRLGADGGLFTLGLEVTEHRHHELPHAAAGMHQTQSLTPSTTHCRTASLACAPLAPAPPGPHAMRRSMRLPQLFSRAREAVFQHVKALGLRATRAQNARRAFPRSLQHVASPRRQRGQAPVDRRPTRPHNSSGTSAHSRSTRGAAHWACAPSLLTGRGGTA